MATPLLTRTHPAYGSVLGVVLPCLSPLHWIIIIRVVKGEVHVLPSCIWVRVRSGVAMLVLEPVRHLPIPPPEKAPAIVSHHPCDETDSHTEENTRNSLL